MIRVVTVLDPFRPGTQRIACDVEYTEGMMLEDALIGAGIDPAKTIAVIDGKGIPPELAPGYPVVDGGEVIAMPHVGGGGFLRTFAELAVVLAAAVVTYGASLTLFGTTIGFTGLGLSAGASSLVASGIALGGNFLISEFMSPSVGSGQDTATYDPTGPKTVASGGTPIPKGYGLMRWGGNVIASYSDAEGQDNYLNVLVCFGWGPALSISDVRINNTPISDYTDATYMVRLGSNTQTAIPYFNNIRNGYPQAARCNAGVPVVVNGTGHATQGLEVVIQFPTGVFYSNDDGSLRSLSLAYKIEYQVTGSGNWQTPIIPNATQDLITYNSDGSIAGYPGWVVIPTDANFSSGVVYDHDNNHSPTAHTPGDPWSGTSTVTYFNADGSSYNSTIFLQGEWQPCDPNLNQQSVNSWSSGFVIFSDANQATLYHTTKIYNLPPAQYDVRVTKYGSAFSGDPIQPREANNNRTGDQVWIHSITEVQYQDLAYPNMILLGVRALATNQLSGNGINVTALVQHDISVALPAALSAVEHDNPAVAAYDMMTADLALYGGGITLDAGAISDMAQWAAYNDELVSDGFSGTIRRHVFNGIFEEQSASLWKCIQRVCALSNCIPAQVGMNYSFAIDGPVGVPSQIFNVGNIKRDSMKDTWLSLDERSNRVEVTFADAARDYRTDEPCAVMTPADIEAGVEVQTTRVQLLGCTSRAQAWHWAYRKLRDTKSKTLTRTFDVQVDGVACQVGSVIGVQDDVTQWAEGGRIQAGSTPTSLVIERSDLTFSPGNGWTVSVMHPTLLRGTATIQGIVGSLVTFTAALPAGRISKCVRASGLEVPVSSYGSNTVMIESAYSFAVGDVVHLYDQDVVDTQLVSAYSGFSITPASPFLQNPEADSPWVYGQSAGAFPAKLFRVTNLKRKGDFDITVDCVIYDPSQYADDTPIITEALSVPDSNATVTGLKLAENYSMANGGNAGQLSTISVGWLNGPSTTKTELWIAQNGPSQPLSSESLLATVSKGTTFTFPAPTGSIVQVRAVGVDAAGTTASWNNSPVQTITVQGSGSAPDDVVTLGGVSSSSGTALTWMAANNAATYEIRYNFNIANSSWSSAQLMWSGTALSWTDAVPRTGRYLIKAVSSASVESVNAATYSYLESGSRLNSVGFEPSQSVVVNVVQNSYGAGGCTVTLGCPVQSLIRNDGTGAVVPESTLTWDANLAASTSYTIYTYIRISDMTLHAALGDGVIPDTGDNPASAAICSAAGNYPGPKVVVTTPASGVGVTDAVLAVNASLHFTVNPRGVYYTVDSIAITDPGSGYVAPVAELSGLYDTTPGVPYSLGVDLAVSGGAIAAATDATGNWAGARFRSQPTVTITR